MKQLVAQAHRDNTRRNKVAAWRVDPSLTGLIKYLYWRSRFPIMQKLLNRLFLLLELALIYSFFHIKIVTSVALLLLGVFAFNAIAFGIRQHFRVNLVSAQKEQHPTLPSALLASCTLTGILLGITAGITLTGVAYLVGLPFTTILYAAAWSIVLPLEYMQATAWMAVYTEHRLRRRISIVCALRLIPTLMLIATHSFFGLYSYIIAILLSRSAESLYLFSLARNALKERDWSFDLPGYLRHAFEPRQKLALVNWQKLWRYLMPQLALQSYQIGLAVALFTRGTDYWLPYCGFVYLLMLFSYLPVRAVQSLEMDIFLALKGADLPRARWLAKRATRAALFVSAVLILVLNILFIVSLALFTLFLPSLYDLWIYFNLALLVRVLFQTRFQLSMAAAIEYSRLGLWGSLIVAAFLPLQLFLVLILRANLAMILLADILVWIALLPCLKPKRDFLLSPFLSPFLKRRLSNQTEIPAAAWLQLNSAWQRIGWPIAYFILQLDADYYSQPASQRLLDETQRVLDSVASACPLMPGWYLVACPTVKLSPARIAVALRVALAGHLRNIIQIRTDYAITQNINVILQASRRVRQSSREQRSITTVLEQLQQSDIILQAFELCKRLPRHQNVLESQLGTALTVLRQQYPELPLISWDGSKLSKAGTASQALLIAANQMFTESKRMGALILHPPKPFLTIASAGQLLILLDPSGLKGQAARNKLRLWSNALTLAFSIYTIRTKQPLIDLPEDLFSFITERVQACLVQFKTGKKLPDHFSLKVDKTRSTDQTPLIKGISSNAPDLTNWLLGDSQAVGLYRKPLLERQKHVDETN